MAFAEIIRTRRKELNLTQEQLCEKMFNLVADGDSDISRQAISEWENGCGFPSVKNLLPLSVVLDLSLDMMFQDELKAIKCLPVRNDDWLKKYPGLAAFFETLSNKMK